MDSSDLRFLTLDHCGDRLYTLEERKIWAQRVTRHAAPVYFPAFADIIARAPGWMARLSSCRCGWFLYGDGLPAVRRSPMPVLSGTDYVDRHQRITVSQRTQGGSTGFLVPSVAV